MRNVKLLGGIRILKVLGANGKFEGLRGQVRNLKVWEASAKFQDREVRGDQFQSFLGGEKFVVFGRGPET